MYQFVSKGVMSYLIEGDWKQHFDITVVNAGKPKWFAEGTTFREVRHFLENLLSSFNSE